MMRKMLRDVALFWGLSGVVIAVALIVVAWFSSHDVGYGLGYGMPWLWAFVSTGMTIVWVRRELEREKVEWGDLLNVHREKPLHLVEAQVDRDAFDRMLARRSSTQVHRVSQPTQVGDRHTDVPAKRRTKSEGHIEVVSKSPDGDANKRSVSEKNVSSTTPPSNTSLSHPQASSHASDSAPMVAGELTQSPAEYASRSDERV